jgi:hypothetical protein
MRILLLFLFSLLFVNCTNASPPTADFTDQCASCMEESIYYGDMTPQLDQTNYGQNEIAELVQALESQMDSMYIEYSPCLERQQCLGGSTNYSIVGDAQLGNYSVSASWLDVRTEKELFIKLYKTKEKADFDSGGRPFYYKHIIRFRYDDNYDPPLDNIVGDHIIICDYVAISNRPYDRMKLLRTTKQFSDGDLPTDEYAINLLAELVQLE